MKTRETKIIIEEIGNILAESNRYLSEGIDIQRAEGRYLVGKICYAALGKEVPEIKDSLNYLEKRLNQALTEKRSIAERVRNPTSNEKFVPNFFALDEYSRGETKEIEASLKSGSKGTEIFGSSLAKSTYQGGQL